MVHYWGNIVEAVFWIVIGVVVFMQSRAGGAALRRIATRAAIVFVVFGASDLVEVRTGAWYRPLWLLVIKAVCVALLVHCLLQYLAWRKGETTTHDDGSVPRG